jgi:hypothetical protein
MTLDREYARQEMLGRPTDELLEILAERDEEEWSPEVFAIVEEALRGRGVRVDEELARLRAERAPAPAAALVAVADFEAEHDADLCRLTLAQAGIEAAVREVADPEPPATQAFEVLVADTDSERANQVLDAALVEADGEGADPGAFRCRSCGFMAEPLREDGRLVCQVCGAEAF